MVAALGDVLEKVLIHFSKLFQRIGAVRLYERLDILREEVVDWRIMGEVGAHNPGGMPPGQEAKTIEKILY